MNWGLLISALAAALSLSFTWSLSVQAANDDAPKFIRIPVYFLTDRARSDKNADINGDKIEFGGERKYRGLCKHESYLGVAYCSIRNTEHKQLTPCLESQGWRKADRHNEGPEGTTLINGPDFSHIEQAFYDKLYNTAAQMPDHEMFMFVPGYMSTFESGLRSAARLGYYSERPVVLYSWASKGKVIQYFADEATVEWSQDHFNDMLGHLNEFSKKEPAVHGRLYAHSMGGRLILRATPGLKDATFWREVSVVCPDVDDGVVKHYAAKYFDGRSDMLVRLYISRRDYMLRLSQFVHGGYNRLGEDRQPLDSLLPKNAPKLVSTANATAEEHPCPESLHRKLLTIDFTAVDIGTLGHRIPVELLSGLSQNGEPGGKLQLCIVTPKGNVIGDDAEPSDSNDGIVRVIKPGWRGTPIMGTLIRYRPRVQLWLTKDWSLR